MFSIKELKNLKIKIKLLTFEIQKKNPKKRTKINMKILKKKVHRLGKNVNFFPTKISIKRWWCQKNKLNIYV